MSTDIHTAILERILPELTRQPDVTGIMLQGSVARQDHSPGSDLDLLLLLENGKRRIFESAPIDGIQVEYHYSDQPNLKRKLTAQPGLVYGVIEGRILHDPATGLTELQQFARSQLNGYKTPEREIRSLQHWLNSLRSKLQATTTTGDNFKTGFLISTNTWKILEGLWATNNRPMPPSGTVLSQLPALQQKPNGLEELLSNMFTGTTPDRASASSQLINWILQSLKEATAR